MKIESYAFTHFYLIFVLDSAERRFGILSVYCLLLGVRKCTTSRRRQDGRKTNSTFSENISKQEIFI